MPVPPYPAKQKGQSMPEQSAVRKAAKLTEGQAKKITVFAALDDIADRRRPQHRWTHPALASLLHVDPVFLRLLQTYLLYRRALSDGQATRRAQASFHGHHKGAVQITATATGAPQDVVGLNPILNNAASIEEQRLIQLLQLAIHRRVSVDPVHTAQVEEALGNACGMPWEELTQASVSQRTARKAVLAARAKVA